MESGVIIYLECVKLEEKEHKYLNKTPVWIPLTFIMCTSGRVQSVQAPRGPPDLICVSLPPQIPTLARCYRERDRERERLRRESETEEEEERERVLGEVSDGEESDDTAYDRRHAIPPCDLP